jgi:hypothetical protein
MHDNAAAWRGQRHQSPRLTAPFNIRDFRRCHAEQLQPCSGPFHHSAFDNYTAGPRLTEFQRRQIFRLRREQILGIDTGHGLTGTHLLPGGIHIQLFQPAGHPCVHVRHAGFIRHHGCDGAQWLGDGFPLHPLQPHTDGLQLLLAEIHCHPGLRRLAAVMGGMIHCGGNVRCNFRRCNIMMQGERPAVAEMLDRPQHQQQQNAGHNANNKGLPLRQGFRSGSHGV